MSVFFFQAEDGIRDGRVTGVQTCALPIYREAAEGTIQSYILAVGVDVALDGALGGLAIGELAELVAHLDAKDLGGLVDVARGLLEGTLAVHHARAGLLAQGGDVLGADLGSGGHAFCSWVAVSVVSAVSGAGSVWASASAVVPWPSASTSVAGGEAGSGVGSVAGGAGCATSAWTWSVWAAGVTAASASGCGRPSSSRAVATSASASARSPPPSACDSAACAAAASACAAAWASASRRACSSAPRRARSPAPRRARPSPSARPAAEARRPPRAPPPAAGAPAGPAFAARRWPG